MANKRVYYAVKSVGCAKLGETTYTMLHGLQQAGTNLKFNLEQVYEIGQLDIYQNIENIPEVEVTLEKALDGYALAYHQLTNGSSSPSLAGRSNTRSTIGMSVFSDVQDSASGTPLKQTTLSGVYVSALSYTLPVNGNCTESVTAVGNNQSWSTTFTAGAFNNADAPIASGGVQRRQHVVFGSGASKSLLPQDIPGITGQGYNIAASDGSFPVHAQSIRIATNLGREEMFELGRRGPYHRFAGFPTQVSCDIEVNSTAGHQVAAAEDAASNLTDRRIVVRLDDGTVFDLGTKNKLTSVTTGGGNAGQNAGNDTDTYSYVNFNYLTVTHPMDPSGL